MKPQFRDVRDRLQLVGTKRDDYDLSEFPDFLIIGPQRTGTTWLNQNLKMHPEVFIPYNKELHYFNNLEGTDYHPSHLRPVDPDLGWYLEQFEIPEKTATQRDKNCRTRWGRPFEPKAVGEATATYAAGLDDRVIKEILALNPDIKIITMVRDPIDRAWSHAKKDLGKERGRSVEEVPESEWIEFFEQPYQIRCGHYSRFLPLWQELVPQANLFVGRFIDVSRDPVTMLLDVYRLLGIDDDERYVPQTAKEQINKTESAGIPPALRARLEELYGEEVERLRADGMI